MDVAGNDRRWQAVLGHRDRLLRIAAARTNSLDEAEDCVQEALLRCVEFTDLDEDRLGAFLTSTTMRLCADEHRERVRQAQIGRRLATRPDVEVTPDETVCERAEADWVAAHLHRLPARQRAVLLARSQGLSGAAAAKRCRLSAKASESALAAPTARLAVSPAAVPTAWTARAAPEPARPRARPSAVLDAGLVSVRSDEPPYSPVDGVRHCYGYGVHASSVDVGAPRVSTTPRPPRSFVCAEPSPRPLAHVTVTRYVLAGAIPRA